MAEDIKPVENHCPFGCPLEDLDELGYCAHLVGFTNDGSTIEPVVLRRRFNKDVKEWIEDGAVMTDGRMTEAVQPDDVAVNPEYEQFDNGMWHKAKRWVSARIYSEDLDREPIPVQVVKKTALRRSMAAPVHRARAGMKVPTPEAKEPAKGKSKTKSTDDKITADLP